MAKTRIITVTNEKGGVAKTTSVLNLAAALAQMGKSVLAIDLDSQSNLSRALLHELPKDTLYTYLLKECKLEDILLPVQENLVLVPSNRNFANFEGQFGNKATGYFLLRDFLRKDLLPALPEKPDFIFMDTPPALGLVTSNALIATQEVFIPMQSQEFSMTALENVVETVMELKEDLNPGLELKGIFFTRHNPRKIISAQMIELLEEDYPGLLMDTYIRVNVDLEVSPSLRQDVHRYNPDSNGSKDYMALAKELLERG